mgnify:CR=1 FL=1
MCFGCDCGLDFDRVLDLVLADLAVVIVVGLLDLFLECRPFLLRLLLLLLLLSLSLTAALIIVVKCEGLFEGCFFVCCTVEVVPVKKGDSDWRAAVVAVVTAVVEVPAVVVAVVVDGFFEGTFETAAAVLLLALPFIC